MGDSHLGWVPAREPGRKAGFDGEVEVESFLGLLHAVTASTEEEEQKLERFSLEDTLDKPACLRFSICQTQI